MKNWHDHFVTSFCAYDLVASAQSKLPQPVTQDEGNAIQDLENFREKYINVMSTIPNEDLPREQTLFNHLIDELERNSAIAPKVQKAREGRISRGPKQSRDQAATG